MKDDDATFELIADERRRLADLAGGWTAAQWEVPSLVEGWRVREVIAHLTMPFAVGVPRMVLGVLRHGGSFDRFADRWARDTAVATSPGDLVATLRANADVRFTPPGTGPAAPLADVVLHGLDVRLPLGLPADDIAPAARAATLRFLTTRAGTRVGVPSGAFAARRFEATDLDWAHGTGPVERATSVDLLAHLARARLLPHRLAA